MIYTVQGWYSCLIIYVSTLNHFTDSDLTLLLRIMDILTGERPVKLEYRYLKAAADQEKKPATDEDLFPFQASRSTQSHDSVLLVTCTIH